MSLTFIPPMAHRKSFCVSILGASSDTEDSATIAASSFLKNSMDRLFGNMKQLPSILPSRKYRPATCLKNGLKPFMFTNL